MVSNAASNRQTAAPWKRQLRPIDLLVIVALDTFDFFLFRIQGLGLLALLLPGLIAVISLFVLVILSLPLKIDEAVPVVRMIALVGFLIVSGRQHSAPGRHAATISQSGRSQHR